MPYRRLFLFVEGDDDELFFRSVILPLWARSYDDVQFVPFSGLKREKVRAFLRSVRAMEADYLWVRDLDQYPCVTAAKQAVQQIYSQIDPARIQVVKVEIESWYCAGIRAHDTELGALDIATCPDTQTVTKEAFELAVSQRRVPRVPALRAILASSTRRLRSDATTPSVTSWTSMLRPVGHNPPRCRPIDSRSNTRAPGTTGGRSRRMRAA